MFLQTMFYIGGILGTAILAILALFASGFKAGRNEQIVKDQGVALDEQAEHNRRVAEALETESRVRGDIQSGGLRNDDGYKRKPRAPRKST